MTSNAQDNFKRDFPSIIWIFIAQKLLEEFATYSKNGLLKYIVLINGSN